MFSARPTAASLALITMLFGASSAQADSFYVCKKKGHIPAWVNEPMVKAKRRKGWRCRKKMQFQGTPRARTSDDGGSPSRVAPSERRPTTLRPARVDSGPAGRRDTYEPYIQEAATRYNVPANLVRAVIRVESNYNPNAVSSAGAKGLMQLMPGTAKDMGVSDLFDPRQNIFGGTRYIRLLINRFDGDPKLALAAYHAGPGVVAARGGIPYEATRRYVRVVLEHYLRYKQARL